MPTEGCMAARECLQNCKHKGSSALASEWLV